MALGAALTMTSCGKKLGQFSADYFTVNPNPLEVVGEKVPATVSAKIPAKFFVKNAEVTVTPYLVFDGREVASMPYSFQGEKVRGNAPVINYEYGESTADAGTFASAGTAIHAGHGQAQYCGTDDSGTRKGEIDRNSCRGNVPERTA